MSLWDEPSLRELLQILRIGKKNRSFGVSLTVVVVVEVVVDASEVDGATELASFKITNSGGGSDSPKSDLVTQHFMAVLQSPSTLRTASQ